MHWAKLVKLLSIGRQSKRKAIFRLAGFKDSQAADNANQGPALNDRDCLHKQRAVTVFIVSCAEELKK